MKGALRAVEEAAMKERKKTKEQLIQELLALRQQVAELEEARDERERMQEEKEQLVQELLAARQKVAELEEARAELERTQEEKEQLDQELLTTRQQVAELEEARVERERIQEEKEQLAQELFAARQKVVELEEARAGLEHIQKELLHKEQMTLVLTESCPNFVIVVDPAGNIVTVNRSLPNLGRELISGTSFCESFPEEHRPPIVDGITKVRETLKACRFEFAYPGKDGGVLTFEASVAPVVIDGETISLIINATDVTERKRMEGVIRQHQEQLRKMTVEEDEERRQWSDVLQNRMTKNLGLCRSKLDALQKSLKYTSWAAILDEVCSMIDRSVQDVILLLDTGVTPSVLREEGLGSAIKQLAGKVQDLHGFKCDVFDDQKPKPLDGDSQAQLFQVVREVLYEAGRRAHAEHVRISLRKRGDRIGIGIEDKGITQDAGHAEHVRISLRKSGDRIGIGIEDKGITQDAGWLPDQKSLGKRLELIGGKLEVTSSSGQGMQVMVTAPLKARGSA
jgi:PAS domain S-box-containing protein